MIAVVGAGAKLALAMTERFNPSHGGTLFLSRTKPSFVANKDWIRTAYQPRDGSVEVLLGRGEISTVVWLATPDARGLFLEKSEENITDELTDAVFFQTHLVRQLLPGMVHRGYGRFIFAGSVGASLGDVGTVLYTQFKYSQAGLSRGVAIEYGRYGVTSNVVNLGYLGGGMSENLPRARREEFLQRTSSRRPVSALDFWRLAETIIENGSLNGSEVNLDGGFR